MPITTDPERLQEVGGELGAAIQAAQRGERVRLPVLQHRDVAGLTMSMHSQLDEAVAARSLAAHAAGHHIACSAGCSTCCVSPLVVPEGEAVTVAEWLGEPAQAEVRAAFLARYPAWRRGVGDSLAVMQRAQTADQQREAAMHLKGKAVMCAFNVDGLCSIYDARPARCRRAHALETNANCGAGTSGEVKYFEHGLTEATFAAQEPMRGALHQALRPSGGLDLLCEAVNRLLGASAGRNEACPCGSGAKFKKCCGA